MCRLLREIVVVDNLVRGRIDNIASAMAEGPVHFIEGDIRDDQLLNAICLAS